MAASPWPIFSKVVPVSKPTDVQSNLQGLHVMIYCPWMSLKSVVSQCRRRGQAVPAFIGYRTIVSGVLTTWTVEEAHLLSIRQVSCWILPIRYDVMFPNHPSKLCKVMYWLLFRFLSYFDGQIHSDLRPSLTGTVFFPTRCRCCQGVACPYSMVRVTVTKIVTARLEIMLS